MATHNTDDKTPDPISSEQAQKGVAREGKDHALERPDPKTETVDKVLTPTSIKDLQRQTDEINQRATKAERKLND